MMVTDVISYLTEERGRLRWVVNRSGGLIITDLPQPPAMGTTQSAVCQKPRSLIPIPN